MTFNRNIYASNNLVLVNTAVDSNAIVFLSNSSYYGRFISIKDSAGAASASNPIYISTVSCNYFEDTSISSYLIQQPFGVLTFAAAASNLWTIQNTFAFSMPTPTMANLDSPSVSTILCKDTLASVGPASIMTVKNPYLYLNGSNATSNLPIPDPFVISNINGGNINLEGVSSYINIESVLSFVSGGVSLPGYSANITYSVDSNHTSWNFADGTDASAYISQIIYDGNQYIALQGYDTGISSYDDILEVTVNTYNYNFSVLTSVNGSNWTNRYTTVFAFDNDIPIFGNSALKMAYGRLSDGILYYVIIASSFTYNSLGSVYWSTNLVNWAINTNIIYPLGEGYPITSIIYTPEYGSNFIIAERQSTLDYRNIYYTISDITSANPLAIPPYQGGMPPGQGPAYPDNMTINNIAISSNGVILVSGIGFGGGVYRQVVYCSKEGRPAPEFSSALTSGQDTFGAGTSVFEVDTTFRIRDVYINQNTTEEVGLPNIIYVGSNTPGNPLVYYTYDPIDAQSNFSFIPRSEFGFSEEITTVNSVSHYGSNIYFSLDYIVVPYIDAVGFQTSNLAALKYTNNLLDTFAFIAKSNAGISGTVSPPITTNPRLKISGNLQTNFLSLNSNNIYASANSLYQNSTPINPIGAYVEFLYNPTVTSNTATYPLYLGTLSNFNNGWWESRSKYAPILNGIILQPGYSLLVTDAYNLNGNVLFSNTNITNIPLYSNIYNSSTPNANASYQLTVA